MKKGRASMLFLIDRHSTGVSDSAVERELPNAVMVCRSIEAIHSLLSQAPPSFIEGNIMAERSSMTTRSDFGEGGGKP